jgi:hypothetical protein
MSLESLANVVERLHERETNAAVGPRGYLSREQGRGFLLGDYENNSVERRRAEGERVSGLLDRILEATVMLDEERGGSSSSLSSATTVADRRRSATSDEDDRRRSTAGSSLSSALRSRVSDLRRGRDATFLRRVDGLLANKGKDPGAIAGGGGTREAEDGGVAIENYARRSIDGDDRRDGVEEEEEGRRKRRIEEGERTMKRLVETPPWLPPHLAEFAATSAVEVPASTWKAIRARGISTTRRPSSAGGFRRRRLLLRRRRRHRRVPTRGRTVGASRTARSRPRSLGCRTGWGKTGSRRTACGYSSSTTTSGVRRSRTSPSGERSGIVATGPGTSAGGRAPRRSSSRSRGASLR